MSDTFPYKQGKKIYIRAERLEMVEGGTSWERGAGICGEEEIEGMWQITVAAQAYSSFCCAVGED